VEAGDVRAKIWLEAATEKAAGGRGRVDDELDAKIIERRAAESGTRCSQPEAEKRRLTAGWTFVLQQRSVSPPLQVARIYSPSQGRASISKANSRGVLWTIVTMTRQVQLRVLVHHTSRMTRSDD
jgi:hypothetical protein